MNKENNLERLEKVIAWLNKHHMSYLLHREVHELQIPGFHGVFTMEGKGRKLSQFILDEPWSRVLNIPKEPYPEDRGFLLKFNDGCFLSYRPRNPWGQYLQFDFDPKKEKIVVKEKIIQLPPKIFEIHFFNPKPTLFKTKHLKDYVKCNYKVKEIVLDKFFLGGTVHKFDTPVPIEALSAPFYVQEVYIKFEDGPEYLVKV